MKYEIGPNSLGPLVTNKKCSRSIVLGLSFPGVNRFQVPGFSPKFKPILFKAGF